MNDQQAPSLNSKFDIIIIGGGPAGSTAASLLAEKGWSVCILEKEKHPRFHIGESLLPMNLPIFDRLGVLEEVSKIGIPKNAAEFNSTDTIRSIDTFYFSESLTDNPPAAFQVERKDLDFLLLNNSRAKGATVIEEMTVTQVELTGRPKQVCATDNQGIIHDFTCRYVIDASGRDSFLATKLDLKKKNPKHSSAAIFCHFENVERRSGEDAGNISIYWIDQGWIWMIPLPNNKMSVGVVCHPDHIKTRNTSLEEFLWDTLHQVPDIAARMKDASPLAETKAAANYSYHSTKTAGDGFLLIGDAFTFIDPVFSSGVFLAMQSGVLGSELVDKILRNPKIERQAIKLFEKKTRGSVRSFSWFIYRFNAYAMRHLLMHNPGEGASQHFNTVKAAVISVFSGENHHHKTLVLPLLIFKFNYYLLTLLGMRNAIGLWIKQKAKLVIAMH